MRRAEIYYNSILAGTLSQVRRDEYIFKYDNRYLVDNQQPAISLTLPKTQQEYRSDHLFPFFFNMLSEGANRQLQSRQLGIDEQDYFGLLLATARHDTIGAVTVKEVK